MTLTPNFFLFIIISTFLSSLNATDLNFILKKGRKKKLKGKEKREKKRKE